MRGHIVGAFGGMLKEHCILRDQFVEPAFQVGSDQWIRIFIERERCGCMHDVDVRKAPLVTAEFRQL